ncbi:SRPBCC family protein [Arthrobacter sp. KK5.5]|uniref:SRPBCC family protein n=1 Tax=Arthrobacter sp. KK5.5 TaxID=3373084 RepID=UPI003EE73744
MSVVEESVFINRPPKEVFDYLARAENVPVWDSSILEAEQIGDGPVRVGTRSRGTSKILGRRFEWVAEYAHFDPPNQSVIRSVEGKFDFTITNSLVPEGGGTRLTYRVEANDGFGGLFGKVADPLVQKAHAHTVRGNLGTLADVLAEHPGVV